MFFTQQTSLEVTKLDFLGKHNICLSDFAKCTFFFLAYIYWVIVAYTWLVKLPKFSRWYELSLCPGTKKNLVPVSLCPGTRAGANVPGQTPLSRDVPGQNEFKNFKKMTRFPVFGHHFPVLEHPFPVLEHPFPVLEQHFLF